MLCCILFFFYIKPQQAEYLREYWGGCILFFFYIKPQHCRILAINIIVVSYSFSTSNHNSRRTSLLPPPVVSYSFSTSNHNIVHLFLPVAGVVSYSFSTSNHNCDRMYETWGIVVSYSFSTSNHNRRRVVPWRFRSKGPQKTDDYFGVKPPKKDFIINKKGRELGSQASNFRSIATQISWRCQE